MQPAANRPSVLARLEGLARRYGSIVAVSGPTDVITDGTDIIRISNGHPYLTQVTGGGCALGAVTAAFLAVDDDPLAAAAAATAVYTVAADLAAEGARAPAALPSRSLTPWLASTLLRSPSEW